MPAAVVFDTNALMLPFERRLPLEKELERLLGPFQGLVPEPCLKELARIASQEKGARRERAKMALSFATRFRAVPAAGPADDAAIRVALEHAGYLLSNDRDVLRRAQREGIPTIRMRGLSHLELAHEDARD